MNKKFYITTAIDYANGQPHIGHALEKIQADVLARHRRQKGDDVFFLTGTDEHGAKIARAALANHKQAGEFTSEIADMFKGLKQALNLSWDDFIRTTDRERHWPGAELLWTKLVASGDIYKKSYKGLYCVGHEAFITQKELVDGKCPDHLTEPEVVEEENYFFKLSKYSKTIGEKVKSGELHIVPESRKNEILSLIEGHGLDDVSFSRPRKDLSWGIPVPGDETQTMYVWCDALTNYISAVGYGELTEEETSWWSRKGQHGADPRDLKREIAKRFFTLWPADVQVIGKDILRFHAAIWPGMLLSAGLPLPKCIFVHGFITANGQKMSKTIGNVIHPEALVKQYGADAVRYYLLREIPTGEDGDFSEEKFKTLYNADLANGLGNFAARVLTLGAGSESFEGGDRSPEPEVAAKIKEAKELMDKKIGDFKLNEALIALWELISFGDEYVNSKAPWKITDLEAKRAAIYNLIVILDNVAAMLAPFLPEAAGKITGSIVWEEDGLKIKKAEVLFPRLA